MLKYALLWSLLAAASGDSLKPPTHDFESAVARIEQRQAQDDSVVAPGGRSIFMSHGARTPRVFVLLHGFTDTPRQFQALGDRFYASGDNVYIPRLPHHAERERKLRAFARLTAAELAAFGDSTIDIAQALGDTVIVVGLSAGANVAASVAEHRSEVYRAVLIAPAIAADRISDDASHGIAEVASRLPNVTRADRPDSERPDFIQGISTRGLAQVLELGDDVRAAAARETARARRIVFILNQNDRTVSNDAAVELARSWTIGAPLVSVYYFGASYGLPHNVLEVESRGGNPALVFPTVEAVARGAPTPWPLEYQFIVSDWNRPRDLNRAP